MSQQVKVYRDLEFWYGGDKTLSFNADTSSTIVYCLPKTDATEYLCFGDGTKNMDVKFFGASGTGAHMLWDESQDGLVFTGTDIQLKDSDKLVFGTGASIAGDVQIYFVDGTGLSIVGSAGNESLWLGSATYTLNTLLYGTMYITGTTTFATTAIVTGQLLVGAGINVTGAGIFNSGASVAGTTTVQTLTVASSIAIAAGGTCTLPQNTNATQFPAADPSSAGQLYVDAGTVKRSAG